MALDVYLILLVLFVDSLSKDTEERLPFSSFDVDEMDVVGGGLLEHFDDVSI